MRSGIRWLPLLVLAGLIAGCAQEVELNRDVDPLPYVQPHPGSRSRGEIIAEAETVKPLPDPEYLRGWSEAEQHALPEIDRTMQKRRNVEPRQIPPGDNMPEGLRIGMTVDELLAVLPEPKRKELISIETPTVAWIYYTTRPFLQGARAKMDDLRASLNEPGSGPYIRIVIRGGRVTAIHLL